MGSTIRAELSGNNKYWIEKHRYYELKHFCLQYPIWKKKLNELIFIKCKAEKSITEKNAVKQDPTADCAETMIFYNDRIALVENIAKEAADDLSEYLLKGITEGVSYDNLKTISNIPCCRDKYYELYRRFFYILNIERQ